MNASWLTLLATFLVVRDAATSPVIWWITPRYGSVAGGTVITLHGSGFASDAYTSSNVVWFDGPDIRVPCDFISYTASDNRIQCRTRHHPDAREGESHTQLQSAVLTSSEYYVSAHNHKGFVYNWAHTPRVELVSPNSGPIGSLVEIAGNFPGSASLYERLYLGDLQCNHINNDTNLPYRIRWSSPYRYVRCLVEKREAGSYNASVLFNDWRGLSWNHSQAMYVMHDGALAMYELFPDVHSVMPHGGSIRGGTLVTIAGSGFGTNVSDIEVDVNGIPCDVHSLNTTHISCWTGRPHDNDPSIAHEDGSYSVTDGGYRFRGSRGVSYKSYHGSISNLESLHNHADYPDNPSRVGVYPSYSTEDAAKRNDYGERLEAFFNPMVTGNYSFFVAADDQAEVHIAEGTNILEVETIAKLDLAVGWNNYYAYPSDQRSDMRQLETGRDYLLVSEFAEAGGGDFINVAVLMHETHYTYSQTRQANRERQLITLSTTGRYEIQRLHLVMNASAILDEEDDEGEAGGGDGVVLEWGGRRSDVIPAIDLLGNPSNAVSEALLSLFSGQCSYASQHGIFSIQFWNNVVYSFESNETYSKDIWLWRGWNGDTPIVVRNESMCGRSSLYLRDGRAVVFDLEADNKQAIELEDYPYYMCFAYKIPLDYSFAIMFRLRGFDYWVSSHYNDEVVLAGVRDMGPIENLYLLTDIRDDDQWHYTCLDLQAILGNGFPWVADIDDDIPDVLYIEGLGFYSNPDPLSRGFYVDEVSFSHSARTLDTENYIPPTYPNGIVLENIIATNDSVAMDDGLVTLTITLEFNPLYCGYDFTPFSAEITNASISAISDVTVERLQEASEPLSGSFVIAARGNGYDNVTTPIRHDASRDEIKAALEGISGIGTITVTDVPYLWLDRYETGCPGRHILVQFDDLAGDQPLIAVESEGLSGDGVSVTVREDVPGGLMSQPIPGHMLQTVEKTPQVHVRVRGQLAACSGGFPLYHEFTPSNDQDTDFCRFSYSPPLTPHVATVTPSTATYGDVVTIAGLGFGTDSGLILVLFGDVPCEVISATDGEISCSLKLGVAGDKPIFLQVVGGNGGEADVDVSVGQLGYGVAIETVMPLEGSQAGGTEITITGTGFAPTSESNSVEWDYGNSILSHAYQRALGSHDDGCSEGWESVVTVGGWECDIITASHMTITCITPANQNAGTTDMYDLVVTVLCEDGSMMTTSQTYTTQFSYSDALTPTLSGVTPTEGSVHGGNVVTITGTGFSDDPSDISVKLGDSECDVIASSATTITCTSPAHSGGAVSVSVVVGGKGSAQGAVQYTFLFTLTSVSHCSGSLLGGQLLDIEGQGFGTDPSQIEVLLGDKPCKLEDLSDTLIRCITPSTVTTHTIDNNASHVEYGLGYVWNPDELTITVGDSVRWNWYGTSFTRQLSVQQVDSPEDTDYNGDGFISDSSTRGSFNHAFTEAGDYYYIAGDYGDIGFRGIIHVLPLQDIEVPLAININSIPTEIPPSLTCGEPPVNFNRYTFANSQTPNLEMTASPTFSYLDENTVEASGLATTPEHNLFTIGGKPCLMSGLFSTILEQPDYSGPARNDLSYSSAVQMVGCELDMVEPGVYRPQLHVAGKGWGLVTDAAIVDVVPAYGPADLNSGGSLRGGTLLKIDARGLSEDDITKTRVEIGNTPCVVQRVNADLKEISCVTQPARDDGYSSLVRDSAALAYWTLQADYYDVDGSYVEADGESIYRNTGSLGSSVDASVRGDVLPRETGISGNSVTNQAALFNASYIEVPFHSDIAHPGGFGMGLWIKTPLRMEIQEMSGFGSGSGDDFLFSGLDDLFFGSGSGSGSGDDPQQGSEENSPGDSGPYHILVDFASFSEGVARGYVIVINPCGQPEFWLATGQSLATFSGSEACPVISTDECFPLTPCSGYSVVPMGTTSGDLPPGVWSVIRCENCDLTDWAFLSLGWEAEECDDAESEWDEWSLCDGQMVFSFNNETVDTRSTTHLPVVDEGTPLLIGGTDRIPLGEVTNSPLTSFAGHLDEVSVYERPLSSVEAGQHYEYGSSEKQKIWIRVESVDGIGTEQDIETVLEWNGAFDNVEDVNWNDASGEEKEISEGTALRFTWTGLKGLWEVSKAMYESCDLANEPIRQWSPPREGGETVVWMGSGRSYFFIDSVAGNCLDGSKITVKVGQVQVITWQLDQTYDEITIAKGTGLLFKWSAGNYHNVIEMVSPQSTSPECSFVGPSAESLGKVKEAWQATPITSGEVAVSGLLPGNHYFVCSVGSHCRRGMRINVTVTTDEQQENNNQPEEPVEHVVSWRIQDYSPLTMLQGEIVTFSWDGFHSLHQVTEEAYETCDISIQPLHIWAISSVDTAVQLTDLQPGSYYFLCTIAGHCDAGMKIEVIVLPSDGLPTLLNPAVALCHSPHGCSFIYSSDHTPILDSVEPMSGAVGTELTLIGRDIIPHGYYDGMLVPTVTVWVGPAPCSDVTVVSSIIEILRCSVRNYEAGYHYVDVFVGDRGFAAVAPSLVAPGPHRNSSEPQGQNSPYPYFFLTPSVTFVSPETGSEAGGTMVTITGSGFSPVAERMNVLLGDRNCAISSSTYSEIVCVTSVSGGGGGDVMVTVNGYEAEPSVVYTFSASSTPTISSITPETGVGGGEIEIVGTGFGSDPSSVSVLILNSMEEWAYGSTESQCVVSDATETSITCSLLVKPAGSYVVVVHITGYGLAQTSFAIQYDLDINSFSPTESGNGGGIEVTIYGSGFPETQFSDDDTESDDSALSVSICSTQCRVRSSTLTEITCILDTPHSDDASSVCDNVVVSYNGKTATALEDTFEFRGDLTPVVASISPRIGGTAGGTIVTITGSNFYPSDVADATELTEYDIIVTIDNTAVCMWYGLISNPTDSSIVCRTSDHKTTLLAEVKVFVRARGFAIPASPNTEMKYQYIDRWSSPYTWGGNVDGLPKEGDSVYIQKGQVVFLDTNTPVLNLILVEGELVFEDEQDLHLQAKYIFINTGRLQVGTEESPFQHNARITLHGTVRDPEIPIYGAKVLGVRQGDLDLHGRPRIRTWTRLAETAVVNSTTLQLQEPVDWVAGDQIVIAATGKDGNETEENEVVSVSANGLTLTLMHKLNYIHLGVTEIFEGGHFIEMRAEVGLLSHNVIVEGSRLENANGTEGLGEEAYGCQIMIHRIGPYPTPIRIEHTEVRYAGQAFRLGRYAIHFHLTGNMNGSYVRNCAIHHSNNRALTAHGVHDLLVEGNVAYDIRGHTFFVEDGIETNNRYLGNLGILTRGSASLLNTDQIPATFWITNPRNTFIGNAAAASRAYGFWYDLDKNPSGASYTTTVCPNKEPFGQFTDNTAHTCNEFGLRIWESYTPYEDGCSGTIPQNVTLYNFTTYNNGIHGVEFSVLGHVSVDNFKMADNVDNGIEIQEANGEWGGAVVKNSLIVAYTSHNHGNPQTGGIKTPNRGRLTVSNVTFVNFDLANSACLRACSHCKVFQGGFQVWFQRLQFYNSPNKAFFQWEHEVLFRDLDGSLTGHPEGGWVLPDSLLLPPSVCSLSVSNFSVNPEVGGASCDSSVYFLRLAWNRAQPLATLEGVSVNVTNEFGFSEVPWRHYRLTHLDGYMCTMPADYPHTVDWLLSDEHNVDTTSYNAGVYNVRPSDHVTITHRFVKLPDHVEIGGNYEPTESGELPEYGVDPHLSWHINNETNQTNEVTYLLSGEGSPAPYNDLTYTYQYEACPRDGCIVNIPDPGAKELRRWSDNSSWTNGKPPTEGEDVIILPQWHMLVDINPPPLGRVFVHGELEFEDGRDYEFTANLILVHGPVSGMTIGTAESPFQNRITITLTGRRGDEDLALTSWLILGSKGIGVFGNVSMHGRLREHTWTRLSSSVLSGSSIITVETNTRWEVGDEIVVAPSGWDVEEGEIRTITDITGTEITLNEPLDYDHQIYHFLDPSDLDDPQPEAFSDPHWWGDGGKMAPEVGLLSHNIVVQGGEDDSEPLEDHHYGCRLLVGRYQAGSVVYSGLLWVQSVEFRYCGQGGYFSPRDPRYSIAFRSSRDTSSGSYIKDSSIHHGYNTAVGLHSSNGITVSGNVVWRTTDSGLKIGGSGNEVLNNLVIHTTTVQPNQPRDNHAVDFPASFDVDTDNVVRGNAAAGSTRIGFRYAGEPCPEDGQPPSSEQASFWDNTAHTGLIGLVILGIRSDCTAVSDFTATHQWNYGVFSSTASSLLVSRLRISVAKVGINLNVFGPDPVQHYLGGKSVTVTDSLIVGSLPGQTCFMNQPDWVPPSSSIKLSDPSFGVMMTSFNGRRSKMDGTAVWHLMKGYPVIDGVLRLTDIVFARFTANPSCPYDTFAIGNNPLSPDAVHPVVMTGITRLNCETDSLVFFHDPNPEWIVQEDCVDMDCDGPKHALIVDSDGRFTGSYPQRGSVAPFAQLRFADYSHRLPESWLGNTEYGERASPDQVLQHEGVARGEPAVTCHFMPVWNAFRCDFLDHRMLVIESMDGDTETRRLSPLALDGGDTGHGHYTDLLNGPMDHGWCTYYTCLKRLSTFFTIVAMGTDYHIWMTGSNPSGLRFHVLNAADDEAIRLNIWYKNPQRKDVYKNGVFLEAENTRYLDNGAVRDEEGDDYVPDLDTSHSGANFFDRDSQILHLVVRGSSPVEIRTAPVVQIAVDLDISLDDFFDPNDLIDRLAFVLKIDPSTIRLVKIVAEDSRLVRQVESGNQTTTTTTTTTTTVTLEFGDPPAVNISQPSAPSIAQEIEMAGEINDSVDIEDISVAELANQTLSENTLNEDPPQSLSEYIASLNVSVAEYVERVEEYQEIANFTATSNELGDSILNAILTNQVEVENATIVGVTVVPAPNPIPPSPPVIPPEYENVTSEGGDNVTADLVMVLEEVLVILEETEVVVMESTPHTLVEGEEGEGTNYVIPDSMRVTMEPREETGHLVHVKLTIFDVDGDPVQYLGLVTPWMCHASLVYNERQPVAERAQLEGVTAVPFVNGVAEFTRLRVDRNANELTLSFATVPARFVAESSVQFSVVRLPDEAERKQVSFLLSVEGAGSVQWGSEEVRGEVARQVGVALDVDISRIQELVIQEMELDGRTVVYVELDLLTGHPSDPPDVPSLLQAEHTLRTLVEDGQLSIELEGTSLIVLSDTYDITPSPDPTGAEEGIDDGDLVLIVAGGGAAVAVFLCLSIVCIVCCVVCCHGNKRKGKKGTRWSERSSVSQLPRLRPSFKVNPIAEDSGESSDDEIEIVRSFRPQSQMTVPPPSMPASSDLWDYDQDDDTDNSSLNKSVASDCWTAPMYATPTTSYSTRVGSKFSYQGNQTTTLGSLANTQSSHRPPRALPSIPPPSSPHSIPHMSHITYVQPAQQPRGRGYRM